jgi:8-oxo-dGTP pyrophosphatase MutT (NUDIX family)
LTRDWVIARFSDSSARRHRDRDAACAAFESARRRAARGEGAATAFADAPRRAAAVLVPLIDRADGMTVLLTRRTEHLAAHAGQISFPGGSIEPGDRDAQAAALREAREEIGLCSRQVTVIGRLDTYLTGSSGFEITPVVGIVAPSFSLAVDPFEVAEAFEVPLAFVLDPRNHHRAERVTAEGRRSFFVLPFENRNIWGATAAILVNLFEVLSTS